ncbi:glycine receptor subunit alphaZ1-like isoform X2 [Actinia tenebrosa]|uniref:Glycine receptor subunit alphaZ1-like isoform X2 n=1 Tax=Actinia tenebrosa TaxID=6105 RepID=A0A6P8IBS1_ACTTE|nr:glycine receptor subunit alphaZ1-like isoform X2 [Actinia tenebrosa]
MKLNIKSALDLLNSITSSLNAKMNEKVLLNILLFVLIPSFAKLQRYNETSKMIDYLLDKEQYDNRLRPGFQEQIVNVTVAMTIVHFGQIREKEMDFNIDIFFYQEWYDERLVHSLPYPINLSGGNHNHLVWMPDTFFLNIKTAKTHDVPSENTKVTIRNNGLVRYSTRLTLTAGCEMNLLDYPLDAQTCSLTIVSYSYPIEDLVYDWAGSTDESIEVMNTAMNEFTLESIALQKENYKYKAGYWTHLNVLFTFKRRIGYSMLQVYAPILLIVTLSWLSFWISKDAAPARIALGITTVLTIVTLMGSLRSEFPKVSYVKAIDLFFIVSFLFVFGTIMEYILVLVKCAMEEKAEKEREGRHKHLAQEMRKEYAKSSSFNKTRVNAREIPTEEGIEVSQNGQEQSSCENQRQASQRMGMPGRTIEKTKNLVRFVLFEHDAHVVDRVSRVAFPLAYLLFNVVYWMYYSFASFS